MLTRKLFLTLLLLPQLLLAQKATLTETSREFLTYSFSDPNPVPILTERGKKIYPYHAFDGYGPAAQKQSWKVIKLENDYIEVYILPEVGGKVWGAIEKSTGKEFIYRNEVMKFRNIALRGPWTSGGIEFNFGFIGHTPATANPVDYITRENADGSVSCIVGNLDLPSRTQWRVEIRLPKDKAYFETRALWNNASPLPQTYYNWMTAAAVVSDDLEFFYPGTVELGHDGLAGPWPVDQAGRDIAKYKNNAFGPHRSSHVVGEYNDFMGGYYHKSNIGFGHWALYNDMPGRKLWLWALSRNGGIWEDLLTDTDGQYMEFQAGRMFNQYQASPSLKSPITYTPFPPHLTDQWKELWFPVKDIGGLRDVSPMGVLNVTHADGKLDIGINALASAETRVVVTSGGKVIHTENKSFKPMDVLKTSVPLPAGADYEVSVEGMDLRYGSEKKNLVNRPFVSAFKADPSSVSYLYQEGMEQKENRGYAAAKKLFQKVLKKDAQHIDAMTAMAELYYRSAQYDSALYFTNLALQLDAYSPAANYFGGITYKATGDLINALETFGWAARSPEYRSTAFDQMAAIELQLGDLSLAEYYAQQSLDFNRTNINALKVLAVLYRKSGKAAQADKMVDEIQSLDPLNHFADFEEYLLHPSDANFTRFASTIKSEFPYQAYLELGLEYYGLGLKDDALSTLEKAPAHPLITLWKAYLKNDEALLAKAAAESPAFVFPYRTETLTVLKWASSKSNTWKFKYYLALNYWAIQREDEALKLLTACGQEPDYAPFYLSRAYLLKSKDEKLELADLQSANRMAIGDWHTWNKLIDYYERTGDSKKALSTAEAATKKFSGNSTLGLQYARALMNNGQYAASIKLLSGMKILPFEGSDQGKAVYEQVYLAQAMEQIKNKKYAAAIASLEKSKEWPESLGVGKPYDPDTRIQDYLEAYSYTKLNKTKEAAARQQAIVEYTEQQYSDASLNNVIGLWVLNQTGASDKAAALVQKIKASSSGNNAAQRWVVASFEKDQKVREGLEMNFSKNEYFKVIKKLEGLE